MKAIHQNTAFPNIVFKVIPLVVVWVVTCMLPVGREYMKKAELAEETNEYARGKTFLGWEKS